MTVIFVEIKLLLFGFNFGLGHVVYPNSCLGGQLLSFLIVNAALDSRNQVFKLIILVLLKLPLHNLFKPPVQLAWAVGALR